MNCATRGMEIKDKAMETADQTRQQAEQAIAQARSKVTEVSRNARLRAADMMHREARTIEATVPIGSDYPEVSGTMSEL